MVVISCLFCQDKLDENIWFLGCSCEPTHHGAGPGFLFPSSANINEANARGIDDFVLRFETAIVNFFRKKLAELSRHAV
jgi:hypothetical protein